MSGLRLLTDPTFDPAGTRYEAPGYTLVKTQAPAVPAGDVGRVDAVLLSHDHHFDNLDRAGRELLAGAGRVLTTRDGAERLGGGVVGMSAPGRSRAVRWPCDGRAARGRPATRAAQKMIVPRDVIRV